MVWSASRAMVAAILVGLCLLLVGRRRLGLNSRVTAYLQYLLGIAIFLAVTEWASAAVGVWVLAWLSFAGLREYLSLVDIRLQDRWGILGAYLSIPFMVYLIAIDWYGLFIISIPVYTFLAIPVLIVLGGPEREGTVLSVGAIDVGLFMMVYCLGHIGYLAQYSVWLVALFAANVALADLVAYILTLRGPSPLNRHGIKYLPAIPLTIGVALSVSTWTQIPLLHSLILGAMIPILVAIGRYTFIYIEADLRINNEAAAPGRGRLMDSVSSSLYAAPIVFHYIRYFVFPEGS